MLVKQTLCAAIAQYVQDQSVAAALTSAVTALVSDTRYGAALNAPATPEDQASFAFLVENLASCSLNTPEFMMKLVCQELVDIWYGLQTAAR